jgi:hypothetical protein
VSFVRMGSLSLLEFVPRSWLSPGNENVSHYSIGVCSGSLTLLVLRSTIGELLDAEARMKKQRSRIIRLQKEARHC